MRGQVYLLTSYGQPIDVFEDASDAVARIATNQGLDRYEKAQMTRQLRELGMASAHGWVAHKMRLLTQGRIY